MGAKLCIENQTDRKIAFHLEHVTIRYYTILDPRRRTLWDPKDKHIDRGLYTLRAIDCTLPGSYREPNMRVQHAGAVAFGIFAGLFAALSISTLPLTFAAAVPIAFGITAGSAAGTLAITTGCTGVAAAVVNTDRAGTQSREEESRQCHVQQCRQAVSRWCHVGEHTKYIVREIVIDPQTDARGLKIEKVPFVEADYDDLNTRTATSDGVRMHPHAEPTEGSQLRHRITQTGYQAVPSSDSSVYRGTTSSRVRNVCDYREKCTRYFNTLGVGDCYLDTYLNKCFCEICATSRGDGTTFTTGRPPKKASVPRGWMKFAIKVADAQASDNDIFQRWHAVYHGTSTMNVKNIITAGDLLLPGDWTPNNERISQPPAHFTATSRPEGFDVNQYFFTPSITYASYDTYAAPATFTSNRTYNVKTVLQVRIRPDSYIVGPQTVGATTPIDRNFSNDELEWSTRRRRVFIIIGVLVKMDQV